MVETGNTSAILGHPANGIAWLANALAEFGIALEPGHIVLPGTCTRSAASAGIAEAHGRIAGLGEVSCSTGAPTVCEPEVVASSPLASARNSEQITMRDTRRPDSRPRSATYFDACNEADADKISALL